VSLVQRRRRRRAGRAALLALGLASGTALAGREPVTVRELVETAGLSGLAVSPDGRTVAVRVDRASVDGNRYDLVWHAVDIRSGARRLLGGGGDAIYADPGLVEPGKAIWSADGRGIYFRGLGDGAIGIWRAAADGSDSTPVLVKDANVETLEQDAGGSLVYSVGPDRADVIAAERREYAEGVRLDSRVDLSQPLMDGGWVEGRLGAQRLAGRWFAREGLLGREKRRRFRFDPATGSEAQIGAVVPAKVQEGPVRPDLSRDALAADGSEASADMAGGQARLVVTANGKSRRCQAPQCTGRGIVWIAWRPGRRELLFAVRDAHLRDSLFSWDLERDRVRRLASADGTMSGGGYNGDLPCAVAPGRLLCIAAGPASPPRLVAVDLATGRVRELLDPNRALRGKVVTDVRRLEWDVAPGRTGTGVLLTPPGRRDAPTPLFITYYRCLGFLKGGEGGEWPIASLVQAGFAVACVNALPSKGSQDALDSYRDAQAAIEALVARLGREGEIDPRRIAMGGFSFGSEVTMWMLTRTKLLRAASIASPQIEPAYYWMNAMRGRDQPELLASVWGIGPPGTSPERWALVSPAASADRVDAPLLIQYSEQEARLNPELQARLSRSAAPVELYAFPDEAHFKVQPVHQWQAMERNLDWLRYWILGEVDPDPAKALQHERWDRLKGRAAAPLPAP
jgi:dipeptidyl aminopeptidase/acylaminoacyl peptidase